jgi:integrase/recombinase XerD
MASIIKYESTRGKKGYRAQWTDFNGSRLSKVFYMPRAQVKLIVGRLELEANEISNGVRARPNELNQVIYEFLTVSKTEGKALGTIARYEKVFKVFKTIVEGTTPLSLINSMVIEEFKTRRMKTVKAVSVNTELRHLKAMFSWATKMEYIVKSPFTGVKMIRTPTQIVRFLSKVEIERLFAIIAKNKDVRAYNLVTFYLQTGARATEILEEGGFTWASIKENHIEIIGKGRKRRNIPLNNTLRRILDSQKGERVPFPYTYSMVSQSLSRRLFRQAGFPEVNIHTLRKTAGANLIQAGMDIYRVSKFLGHSSVKVTEQHYVDLLQSDYQEMSTLLEMSSPSTMEVSEPIVSKWIKVA